jgi:2-keto-4-pentenoate hydratase/2-oxohepta-3-ene-1,7-dioic acid hydratase in catechol pathway
MKLASFVHQGRPSFGTVEGDSIRDLGAVMGPSIPDLKSLLAAGVQQAATVAGSAPRVPLDAVQLLPPIPNSAKVFGTGYNYQSHIEEVNASATPYPFLFVRFADSQVGSGQPLVKPRVTEKFDYQGSLAVVIGRPGRHIARQDALSHVAGYACYNDGSVRDWQRHTTQFTAGKNFPATGGFGPWLVTADELTDPRELTVVTRHNGREVQRESVANLLHDVPALVTYCSEFTELGAGDVIVTGTPGGVGARQVPPLWLVAGVTVEVEIEGIGILRNPVVDEAA